MADIKNIMKDIDDSVSNGKSVAVNSPEACNCLFSKLNSQIKIFSQNIRSINHNFDNLRVLITRFSTEFDIIILTECWLTEDIALPTIPNYNNVSSKRNINQNDGIVIFFKSDLPLKTMEPSECQEANCLVSTIGTEYAFVSIYRPPSFRNTENFISSLDSILNKLKYYKNVILMGDININIIDNRIDLKSVDYLEMLASHGLFPSHTIPTRGNNCLDHCMIKSIVPSITIVCDTSTTDHSTVILSMTKFSPQKSQKPHSFKKTDYLAVINELKLMDWIGILDDSDVNKLTNLFLYLVNMTLIKYTSTVNISRRKTNIKPWITPGLIRCFKNRDKLHQEYKKNPLNETISVTYKRYRNTCNNIIKKLKRAYQISQINEHKHNLKKQWALIKQFCNLKNNSDSGNEILTLKSSPHESLNYINRYFTSVGSNLAREIINKTNKSEKERARNLVSSAAPVDSMLLLETDVIEVKNTIKNLKNSLSTGWDGISSSFLKFAVDTLALPITIICNLCFRTGTFPDALKRSVVIPIHKSGDRDCISNYRPISLLPAIAKVIEKIINKRLKSYLEKNNLLSTNQHGFREGKSTEDALLQLTNYIVDKLDRNKRAIGIFLDLQKAFDTVSVPILIKKMENIGIRGLPLQLLTDYLKNRKQAVRITDVYSREENIEYGVPQGSVLGPTLFLIYIDDLCRLKMTNAETIAFADDTAILFYGDSWEDVNNVAQYGFNKINDWLSSNLLTLNFTKTKCMYFSIKNNKQSLSKNVSIKIHTCQGDRTPCSCQTITETSSIKYLGVLLDRNLSWHEHITCLAGRIRKLIYIFRNLRHICDKKLLITVYYALCQSITTYCITAWGGASKTCVLKLERAQRAVLKVLTFNRYRYPTTALYQDIKLLTVRQLFIKSLLTKQHKNLPDYSESRRRTDIVYLVPQHKTKFAKKFIKVLGPTLYNKLSKNIHLRSLTLHSCKRVIVDFLQKLTYENTEKILSMV